VVRDQTAKSPLFGSKNILGNMDLQARAEETLKQ